jgi:CheY-like chemotaxis protein
MRNESYASHGGYHCLIVEDNIHAAEIMSIYLERNGISFETAANGQDGLRLYLNNPLAYNAVFADLQMPVMNGIEMMKRIRESGLPNANTIPIIAMSGTYTGYTTGKDGFNYFLKKPFEMRRLAEIIHEVRQAITD